LIIISKDADFSNKIILKNPPPKVIHIKVCILKIRDLHKLLIDNWPVIDNDTRSNGPGFSFYISGITFLSASAGYPDFKFLMGFSIMVKVHFLIWK